MSGGEIGETPVVSPPSEQESACTEPETADDSAAATGEAVCRKMLIYLLMGKIIDFVVVFFFLILITSFQYTLVSELFQKVKIG